jgi:hypothetical protein
MHVPKENEKTLDEKYKSVFNGYGEIVRVKGYKLWIVYEHKNTYG